jgi:hypothetical protein
MLIHMMMLAPMVCGMGVEVTGTEHVAAASFDVAGGHIKIGFRSFLLRERSEVDEASGNPKERKYKDTRDMSHFILRRNCVVKGLIETTRSLCPKLGRYKILPTAYRQEKTTNRKTTKRFASLPGRVTASREDFVLRTPGKIKNRTSKSRVAAPG